MRNISRRELLGLAGLGALGLGAAALGIDRLAPRSGGEKEGEGDMLTVFTFGDSILDCGHYNQYGVHPGQLVVRNDDRLFPEFRGNDLTSRREARLEHRAVDGATVNGLPSQARGLKVEGPAVAMLTVGGNDLLQGLVIDDGSGIKEFAQKLEGFLKQLPIR
ncbi:MAG TPA: hypothetical protein VEY08_05990, partial [Chloroflexia bacterium]|nr:hypothetical protein [Chloroflexia bacterium]